MKIHLFLSFLLAIPSVCLSQDGDRGRNDYCITHASSTGQEMVIKVVNNSISSIPTAIILVGDPASVTRELRDCDAWSTLKNRTYVIDQDLNQGIEIQEVIDHILSCQKVIDANLYLIQSKDEFEHVVTKPYNIGGATVAPLEGRTLCNTFQDIVHAH